MSSYGQSLARRFLEGTIEGEFIENYRPSWLFGMELDFYYPEYKVAFEFNGDQHYCPTSFGCPIAQLRRDRRKKQLCRDAGIKLVILDAIDLQIGIMRRKARLSVGKRRVRDENLKELSDECVRYRKLLISKYESPTARRKGKAPRKKAMADAWAKVQKNDKPITKAERDLLKSKPI